MRQSTDRRTFKALREARIAEIKEEQLKAKHDVCTGVKM